MGAGLRRENLLNFLDLFMEPEFFFVQTAARPHTVSNRKQVWQPI
jgi:hypothetical protein